MEVVEQAARVGHIPVRRHHRKLRDATAQLAPQLVRPDLRLVDREVRVPWHSRPTPHFRETAPRTRTRCASRARPQPQSGVRRRLVLQQHVQPCRRAAGLAPDHVQQVGFALAQAVVNEADRIEPDARPQQAAMKRVGLRTGWLALVALFFLPPQRSLPRGAGANLLDVASLPPCVTPMFRLPAVEILGDAGISSCLWPWARRSAWRTSRSQALRDWPAKGPLGGGAAANRNEGRCRSRPWAAYPCRETDWQ